MAKEKQYRLEKRAYGTDETDLTWMGWTVSFTGTALELLNRFVEGINEDYLDTENYEWRVVQAQ